MTLEPGPRLLSNSLQGQLKMMATNDMSSAVPVPASAFHAIAPTVYNNPMWQSPRYCEDSQQGGNGT